MDKTKVQGLIDSINQMTQELQAEIEGSGEGEQSQSSEAPVAPDEGAATEEMPAEGEVAPKMPMKPGMAKSLGDYMAKR